MSESTNKGLLSAYREIFAAPGSVAFSAAGFVARLPIAMIGIGIVTMISQLRGDYALAGALAAVFALSSAIIRSEEHTSELQSLMRISYAVFCLKKKNKADNVYQQLRQ